MCSSWGISAIALGTAYLVVTGLYVAVGEVPSGMEPWLSYLAGQTELWWAILGLSVLTDFLFLPVLWSVYEALKSVRRGAVLTGVGLVGLFVILDLTLTWPNFAALISLSADHAVAAEQAQRAAYVAAASYPVAILTSRLLAAYIILVPGLGILLVSLAMRMGTFNRATAYVGVLTGVFAVVTVVGSLFVTSLNAAVIATAVLTTLWVFLVGFRLVGLAQKVG